MLLLSVLVTFSFSTVVLFVSKTTVSLISRFLRPYDVSARPGPLGQYAGWQPSLQVLTVASNTKKFDSGILNALNLASKLPSFVLACPNSGKTNESTGHLQKMLKFYKNIL